MNKKNILSFIKGIIIPVLIVILWFFTTNYTNTPESILPKISTVGHTITEMLDNGQLQEDLGISLSRVLKGYLTAAVLGIAAGSLIGMSDTAKDLLQPVLTVIRQIPIIAWVPLIILWCGIGEESKIVVIVLASFFPVMVNTATGIRGTSKGYIEVARLYKLSRIKTFAKVYLPHSLPSILVGLRLGLGTSWMAVVAAELIASLSGIGYRMSNARSLMNSDVVIVCMLVIGLFGIIMDKLLGLAFSLLTPWTRADKGK